MVAPLGAEDRSFGSCGSFFKLSSHNVKQAGLANCRAHKEGHKLNLKSSKYLRLHIDKCVALKPVIQTLRESTGCSVSQDLTCRILLVKLVVRKEPCHTTKINSNYRAKTHAEIQPESAWENNCMADHSV